MKHKGPQHVPDDHKPEGNYVPPGNALLVLVLIVGAIIAGAFGQPIAMLFLAFALVLLM